MLGSVGLLYITVTKKKRVLKPNTVCCAQHPGIGHVIDGSTAYTLPRKPEGQPHTYNTDRLTLCLTYRLTCVSTAS
jgi:hypothetical protein